MSKMKLSINIFLAIILLNSAFGQSKTPKDTVDEAQISIIKEYKPTIKQSEKISFSPAFPSLPKEAKKLMEYSFQNKPFNVKFDKLELRPIAYTTPKSKKPNESQNDYNGYVKLGFGNFTTPFFKAGYVQINDLYEYGATIQHVQSNNKKLENQVFSNTNANFFAKKYFDEKGFYLQPELNIKQHSNRFFGYNHKDTSFEKNAVQQRFFGINLNGEIKNYKDNKRGINYSAKPYFNLFSDKYKTNEFIAGFYSDASKKISTHFIKADFTLQSQSTKDEFAKRNNFLLRTTPAFEFNKKGWQLDLGLNITLDEKEFLIYPFLGSSKSLFDNKLVFYNGWKIIKQQNSYEKFAEENPFINPQIITQAGLRNTRFEDRYMGVKGFFNKFDYNIRFAQKLIKNMPIYVNDTFIGNKFNIIYDDVTIMHLHTAFQYDVDNVFTIYTKFDFNGYKTENEKKAWHLPTIRTNIGAIIKPIEALQIRAELYANNGSFYKVYGDDDNYKNHRLKGMFDINIGAEYAFMPNLSAFIQLNNITSQKYEQYKNYTTFGFNGVGGIRFTF